ncbi:BMC domain-containing protein [Clostridium malenominatum]|uniref:BMC domain-containing protein n=1 Tax=Clostridium malenominatum TaxID=1539 RepID=A0ABP3TZJ7_9CLOT
MKKSIGLVELRSIAKGIEATDEMLKAANVEIVLSTAICPGKYITIIKGEVGAVKSSIAVGKEVGDTFLLESFIIPNVSEDIFPALSGTTAIEHIASLGVVETMSATASIIAGDILVKSANVKLIEIRLARGLGGKGFVLITGDVSSIKTAIKSCEEGLKETGSIVSTVVIPSPSKELVSSIFQI